MPFKSPNGAMFSDYEDCVKTLMDGDMSREEAEAVCGKWQSAKEQNVDLHMLSDGMKKRLMNRLEEDND